MAEDTTVSDQTDETTDDEAVGLAAFGDATGTEEAKTTADDTEEESTDSTEEEATEKEATESEEKTDADAASEDEDSGDDEESEPKTALEQAMDAGRSADNDESSTDDDEAKADAAPDPEAEQIKAELEATKAELKAARKQIQESKGEETLTVETLVGSIEDADEKEELEKFLNDYPENTKLFNMLLNKTAADGSNGDQEQSQGAVQELREKLAWRDHIDCITYGFRDEDGNFIEGHQDTRAILNDPDFVEWTQKSGAEIKKLNISAERNPKHGVLLISAYKEKRDADQEHGDQLDAKDEIHMNTTRGNKKASQRKRKKESPEDGEAAFEEALAAQSA